MTAPALPASPARRPSVVTVALVLLVLTAILNLLPGDETPPLAFLLASSVDSVLLIGAAVGLWTCRRWGCMLGVVALALNIVLALVALVFGPAALRLVVAVGIVLCVVILVLLVLPAARRAYR